MGIECHRPYSSDKGPLLNCEEIIDQIVPSQLEFPFYCFECTNGVFSWYLDNRFWLVSRDNEGSWVEWRVNGDVVGARIRVFGKRVRHGIGFSSRHGEGFVVYEVLDCMAKAKAVVSWMADVLMVSTVGIGIVGGGKFLREWSRRKWLEDIIFDQFFEHCGERC